MNHTFEKKYLNKFTERMMASFVALENNILSSNFIFFFLMEKKQNIKGYTFVYNRLNVWKHVLLK